MLGGGPTSRFWHPIFGVVFLMGTLWMQNLWRRDMEITETDRRWLDRVENYITNRDELLPLQERFNAGQKLFYWLMFYGALLLLLSGFFMWIPEYIPRQAAWVQAVDDPDSRDRRACSPSAGSSFTSTWAYSLFPTA